MPPAYKDTPGGLAEHSSYFPHARLKCQVGDHLITVWPAAQLEKNAFHPTFMAYPGMVGQMYKEFDFTDDASRNQFIKASRAVDGDINNVLLPHEVVLLGVIEYGHKEVARIQYGWVVYSTFSHVGLLFYFHLFLVFLCADYSSVYAQPAAI